jgi:hypothetical protein
MIYEIFENCRYVAEKRKIEAFQNLTYLAKITTLGPPVDIQFSLTISQKFSGLELS